MTSMKHAETLEPVLTFLETIGVDCRAGDVHPDSFLPGIEIQQGRLIFDADKLASPGDLLHEAGHIAAVPSKFRTRLSGDIDACLARLTAEDAAAEAIIHTDLAPIAWSYAAALEAGINPLHVFDAAGYGADKGGDIQIICQQLQMGLFPGIAMLARLGLCAAPPPFGDSGDHAPYPHMKRWLAA
jgi:hypothetical protein